jgi:hypothetical protein
MSRAWRRFALPLSHARVPRYTGVVAGLSFLLAAAAYGVVKGEHIPTIVATIKSTADAAPTRSACASPRYRSRASARSGARRSSRPRA